MSGMFDHTVEVTLPDGFFGNGSRILPANGALIDLAFLVDSLELNREDYVERFIPKSLFVREEMETAFKELLHNGSNTSTVFSGSPGIGKSILTFLVAMYCVWNDSVQAVFFRYVKSENELVSMFAMNRLDNGSIRIRFTRNAPRSGNMPELYEQKLRAAFQSDGTEWYSNKLFAVVDGPDSDQLTHYSLFRIACTSGAGIQIKHHMAGTTFNVVMGAWTKIDLKSAVLKELAAQRGEHEFSVEKFDNVYFVNGGRIRGFLDSYRSDAISTEFADATIDRISKSQVALSLSHSDCRSTDDHVDSLRSMFRNPGGATDSVHLHVDSHYMLRGLREKLSGEELFDSYKKAVDTGNEGAQAGYFEEMMHWCYSNLDDFPCLTDFVRADKGQTGAKGVAELTRKNQYWIPSIPNFVNIDSAIIGSDEKIWCLQFTVSLKHTYRKRKLRTQFLNHISFLDGSTDETTIIFVVPEGTAFVAPTQDEVSASIAFINCTSLETVRQSEGNVVALIAP